MAFPFFESSEAAECPLYVCLSILLSVITSVRLPVTDHHDLQCQRADWDRHRVIRLLGPTLAA